MHTQTGRLPCRPPNTHNYRLISPRQSVSKDISCSSKRSRSGTHVHWDKNSTSPMHPDMFYICGERLLLHFTVMVSRPFCVMGIIHASHCTHGMLTTGVDNRITETQIQQRQVTRSWRYQRASMNVVVYLIKALQNYSHIDHHY